MKNLPVQSSESIPLLAEVDLLIIDGGLAGLPVARRLAQSGKRVLLVEAGTFLGYEMGAWLRPWLCWHAEQADLARLWFPLDEVNPAPAAGDWLVLRMLPLKRAFEDRLLEAGVQLLYTTRPVACRKEPGSWVVVLGNKSGRQMVRAHQVLDTSETGLVARLAGMAACRIIPPPSTGDLRQARRTLEFTRVAAGYRTVLTLPGWPGISGGQVLLRGGAGGSGHVLVDIPMGPFFKGNSLAEDAEIEYQARKLSLEVGEYLVRHMPEFRQARLGWGSTRLMPGETLDPLALLGLGEQVAGDLERTPDSLECLVVAGRCLSKDEEPQQPGPVQTSPLEYCEHSEFNSLRRLQTIHAPIGSLSLLTDTQVLVVGGGTSGAVAACAAGEEKVRVALLEMNDALGGTATLGGVSFYWFGNRVAFTHDVDRRVMAWHKRLTYPAPDYLWSKKDSWSPELRAFTLLEWCRETGVEVFFGCMSIGALCEGKRVAGAVVATPYGPCGATGQVTVDASGDGDIAAFAGVETVYGNERDAMAMWSSLAWFSAPGVYRGGSFATTTAVDDVLDTTRFILSGRRRGSPDLYDHASYLAPRESRHILGEVVITLADQFLMRQFPDTVSICFSNHDTKGKSAADLVYFGLLPPHMDIPIPYRALIPRDVEDLIVTGKALSCTHDALSAIRMIDDLQQQGGVAGLAAAMSVKKRISPRRLDVPRLQRRLVRKGLLPAAVLEPPESQSAPDYQALVDGLSGDEPWEWIDMSIREKLGQPSPLPLLCLAPRDQVLPLLLTAHARARGTHKLVLARLLCWHGDVRGVEGVLAEIRRQWQAEPPLPRRKASIRYCQLYPDHGVMAEPTYLVQALAWVRDPRIVPLLSELVKRIEDSQRDYTDMRLCMFNYVESVAYVAERLAFPEFGPLLERLLALPELQTRVLTKGFEVDLLNERLAYLCIALNRALARCGFKNGLLGLAPFTADARTSLARSACQELSTLTGMNHAGLPEDWESALSNWPERFDPQPWTRKLV